MLNKFIGIGRNTKDGELRVTEKNTAIYTNRLAITNNFKNKEGNYDSEFINYVAYGITGDYLKKYSTKGTLIQIEGRFHTRSYEENKEKKYITEIVVESASVLEKRTQEQPTLEEIGVPDNYKTDYDNEIHIEDKDLPF